MTFDLRTEPWIPVRTLTNGVQAWSLRDAVLRADEGRAIEHASPLVEVALLRLLLAFLHRALEGPNDIDELADWYLGGFPAQPIERYLDRWADRFDLFSEEQPFFQVPDFTSEMSSRSWTVLAPDRNTDNNKVLFDHTPILPPEPVAAAEAARLLVATQTFVLGGGRSPAPFPYTASAPDATSAMTVAVGSDLRQTLCLNLVQYAGSARVHDLPWWERDRPYTVQEMAADVRRGALGITDRYTWPSRSVRLHPEPDARGRPVVRHISFASGVRYAPDIFEADPMAARRTSKEGNPYAVRLQADRGFWRDLDALIPRASSAATAAPRVVEEARVLLREVDMRHGVARQPHSRVSVMVVGQVNKQAKVELWRRERHVLPEAITADLEAYSVVRDGLDAAEAGARALAAGMGHVVDKLPGKSKADTLLTSVPAVPRFWSTLQRAFPTFLDQLDPEHRDDEAEDGWSAQVMVDWWAQVGAAADDAWQLVERAVGLRGEALTAVAAGRGRMYRSLARSKRSAA